MKFTYFGLQTDGNVAVWPLEGKWLCFVSLN